MTAAPRARVVAVLGPTNTGKTHLAVERMLGYGSGVIGLPLRLLAREVYDRVVRLKGPDAVALVTGEEKIRPARPRYFVCTTEAMPLERQVDFVAVDEIQLAADDERGHVFTDRLLHARGVHETLFLGADTIRPVVRRLVPDAEYVSRPRFSRLAYAGARKITRLPARSAIVAFSAAEVYRLAEALRGHRGGAAVVLGALSPRARNAQVAMFQAGEVDYLVATDAIGMGLNMDVNHVAFAGLRKFDGAGPRALAAAELAQIAGRAGRHMNDGTFGTTAEAGTLAPEAVAAIESHAFPALKAVRWRNDALGFGSLGRLLRDLEAPPPDPVLVRQGGADDHMALVQLARDPAIAAMADSPESVRLLWEVCQVPDFRKTLAEAHVRFLATVFRHLRGPAASLPEDWVARSIERLDRTHGDIDTLMARIAHIRTWTYVAHRAGWLRDPAGWQERTRAIEDRLSDALHDGLTHRFVDRRTSALVRGLKGWGELAAVVAPDGAVAAAGQPLGRLEGFRFVPLAAASRREGRAVWAAAERSLAREIARRLRAIEEDRDEAIAVADDFSLAWRGWRIARLVPGPTALEPRVEPFASDLLDGPAQDRLRRRLALWLRRWSARALAPLHAARQVPLRGAARGLVYHLTEALGTLPAAEVQAQVRGLAPADRQALARIGLRLGRRHAYLKGALRTRCLEARALLWAVAAGASPRPPVPADGRQVVARDPALPDAFYRAIGFLPLGIAAVRADLVERLARLVRDAARRAGTDSFALPAEVAAALAAWPGDTALLLADLGYRPVPTAVDGQAPRFVVARRPSRAGGTPRRPAAAHAHSPFAKLAELTFKR